MYQKSDAVPDETQKKKVLNSMEKTLDELQSFEKRAFMKWNTNSVNPALRYRTQEIYLVMHDLSNNEKRSLVQRIAHSLPPAEKAEQSGVSDEKRE